MERTGYRICPLCEACCGLEVQTRGGQVVSVRGAGHDVFSRGYLCPKGAALGELHDDPDRLRRPLVRRGRDFEEVSWEAAFAEIERRLPPLRAEHGADAVGMTLGNPVSHKFGLFLYGGHLARALGTRNLFSASTLDQMPKQLAAGLMFGHWLTIPVPDLERTDLLLILGANPLASNGSLWTVPDVRGKLRAAKARGARIVVVDPRRTETAALADRHLFLRPGADAFLLAALLHTIFAEGLARLGPLAEHVRGTAELERAVAPFSPERVAARTGISAQELRELARELAAAPRACVYGRLGTCTQELGTVASWLVDALNVVLGQLDRPGGAMFPKAAAFAANTRGAPGRGKGITTGRRHSRVSGAPEVGGELPMGCLAEEIETPGPGQLRALITLASNPVLSAPDGPRLAAALERLELMISVDLYVNETTRHAHVILPGRSPLYDSHFDALFPQWAFRNTARASAPLLPAPDDHPAEWEVLLTLLGIVRGAGARADRSELDDELVAEEVRRSAGPMAAAVLAQPSPWRGPDRLVDLALRAGPHGDLFGARPQGLSLARVREAPGGVDLGALEPRVPEILRTPSGKIELAPEPCLAQLAAAQAQLDEPAPPLVVIGRRHLRSNNSWLHNLPTLASGKPRTAALVHPKDAAAHGLTHGGRALLRRRGGQEQLVVEIEVSDQVMPGVVSLPHGWGHDLPGVRLSVAAARPGVNLNAILDPAARDPLSGTSVLSGVAIELEAIS